MIRAIAKGRTFACILSQKTTASEVKMPFKSSLDRLFSQPADSFLKDRCALSDQMSLVFTFPGRRLVLAMGDRHGAYQNEGSSFVLGETANNFGHSCSLLTQS